MLTQLHTMALIFITFIVGVGSGVSTIFITKLILHINKAWKKLTGKNLPALVGRRAIAIAIGPAILTAFSIVKLFLIFMTTQDTPEWVNMLVLLCGGLYCAALPIFVHTLVEALFQLGRSSVISTEPAEG